MSNPGESNIWTPSRLRTQLAAQKGIAPAPGYYIIWRTTAQPDAAESGGYELPGVPARQDEAAFERWLLERDLAGPGLLSVSVLVIRERLDETGLILECVLERRRGSAEGPYHGNVARVEFTGAAKQARRYRAARDGRLRKLPAKDDTRAPRVPSGGVSEAFSGEDAAVHAYLGEGAVILDRRGPALLEDLVGLSGIVHARRRDGITVGCGVGWHGGVAFVLAADFPRDRAPLVAPLELEAAVAEAVKSGDLVRLETRHDELGFCVIATDRGRRNLVTIRRDGTATRIARYAPGRVASANDEQRRWMAYAETYEARAILDSWRNGESDEIAVVTVDQDKEAWRHVIDADGIEVSRRPDNEAAAVLYRGQTAPPTEPAAVSRIAGSAADRGTDWIDAAPDETVPADSLLVTALAWSRAAALLRAAIAEAGAATGRMVPRAVLGELAALNQPLEVLGAGSSAGSFNRLMGQARSGAIAVDGFAAALEDVVRGLRDELALIRIVTLPNARGRLCQ